MPDLTLPEALLAARAPLGLVGALLLLAGARLYRLAIVGPGFAAGVIVGLQVTGGASPSVQAVAALSLGVVGAVALLFLERVAVAIAGAVLCGGLADAVGPAALGGPVPWYVPLAAALLGLLLFPRLYKALLPVLTSIIGALCLTRALDRPHDLALLGGLALVGIVVQLITRKGKRRDD